MALLARGASSDISDVLSDLTDRQLILTGKFNAEIQRLAEVKAEAEEKLGMVQMVEDAAKIKTDAEAYAKDVRVKAEQTLASATAKEAQLDMLQKAASSHQQQAIQTQSDAAAKVADYEARKKTQDEKHAAREADLAKREAALAAGQAKLGQDAGALDARHKALLDKIEAWKALPV